MRIAIEEAKKADYPYAVVLVKNNKVIAKAKTASKDSIDPTAHAEITAIREACIKFNSKKLEGVTLYSTVELCPMCFTASWWAGISEIVYGISLDESSKLLFPEINVTSQYLNENSGNKIKITGGILSEDIRKIFKDLKESS